MHLATDAAQCCRRQHALGSAAGPDIHIDAGIFRIGAVNNAGDVAVGDERTAARCCECWR